MIRLMTYIDSGIQRVIIQLQRRITNIFTITKKAFRLRDRLFTLKKFVFKSVKEELDFLCLCNCVITNEHFPVRIQLITARSSFNSKSPMQFLPAFLLHVFEQAIVRKLVVS